MINDNLYMKDLIPKKYKHLLYKDENPELTDFLILKYAEIYIYSKTSLRVLTWSYPKAVLIRSKMSVSYDWSTGDGLYILEVPIENLDDLVALGATKKRIYRRGTTLHRLEEKLGHKIIPFNPELEKIDVHIGCQNYPNCDTEGCGNGEHMNG